MRSHRTTAKPMDIKEWNKTREQHSLQQHDGRSSRGGIQNSKGEKKRLYSDSGRCQIKALKPPWIPFGKEGGAAAIQSWKSHSLFPTLLLSCLHKDLHRLKQREPLTIGWYWFVVEWLRTESWGNPKCFCLQHFHCIFLCHYVFFPHIPSALDPIVSKPSVADSKRKAFYFYLFFNIFGISK